MLYVPACPRELPCLRRPSMYSSFKCRRLAMCPHCPHQWLSHRKTALKSPVLLPFDDERQSHRPETAGDNMWKPRFGDDALGGYPGDRVRARLERQERETIVAFVSMGSRRVSWICVLHLTGLPTPSFSPALARATIAAAAAAIVFAQRPCTAPPDCPLIASTSYIVSSTKSPSSAANSPSRQHMWRRNRRKQPGRGTQVMLPKQQVWRWSPPGWVPYLPGRLRLCATAMDQTTATPTHGWSKQIGRMLPQLARCISKVSPMLNDSCEVGCQAWRWRWR